MPAKSPKNSRLPIVPSALDFMPKQKGVKRVLGERAKSLAIHEQDKEEKKGYVSYIWF